MKRARKATILHAFGDQVSISSGKRPQLASKILSVMLSQVRGQARASNVIQRGSENDQLTHLSNLSSGRTYNTDIRNPCFMYDSSWLAIAAHGTPSKSGEARARDDHRLHVNRFQGLGVGLSSTGVQLP